MKIAICAGKTGGHIFPALAVAKALKEKRTDVDSFFIGTRSGMDAGILKTEGFRFIPISGCGLPTGFGLKSLKCIFSLGMALIQVLRIYLREKPSLVLSFGGYISCAPVLVARCMNIPVVIHEANVRPGRANRFLSRWADIVCTAFDLNRDSNFKMAFVDQKKREQARSALKLDADKFIVLVMGGSLGSRRINECLIEALHELGDISKRIQILHVTGKGDYDRVMKQYQPNGVFYRAYPFIENVENAFYAADLFVGRAGASTLAEVVHCGVPSILIPYPYAMDDHQLANAEYFAREGAAQILKENSLSSHVLAQEISKILINEKLRQSMIQNMKSLDISDGASRIVQVIESLLI
jgi:UDP-N-acetylglucosamine--N-acetylmuramyl-(pentapeptide) pyrophosphoryl-undecaprenol N-acetylglucosamine transferase